MQQPTIALFGPRRPDIEPEGSQQDARPQVRRGMFASGFGKQSHKRQSEDEGFDIKKVVKGPRHPPKK